MSETESFFGRLFRVLGNFLRDVRYGAFLGGNKKTPYSELGAYDTVNSSYSILPILFKERIKPTDVLVDIGCGKGRVINWWLDEGYKNKIIGLELDEDVASKTSGRLNKYSNVIIIAGDAIQNIPDDGTLFYLYSPFNEGVMLRFSARLKEMFMGKKDISLIYYNPEHAKVFESDECWLVEKIDAGPENKYQDPLLVRFSGVESVSQKDS